MPDEIMDKLPDFKKPAYNTDNMGKLFVTLFAFLPAGRQGLHRDSFHAFATKVAMACKAG